MGREIQRGFQKTTYSKKKKIFSKESDTMIIHSPPETNSPIEKNKKTRAQKNLKKPYLFPISQKSNQSTTR